MTSASSSKEPFDVLIVGGGVAALALRDLGGERIATTMIAPNPEFVYRPMTVRERFGYATAQGYPLDQITRHIGVELRVDSFISLDGERGVVHTEEGEQLPCDALLVALGAGMYDRFEHALTLDDARLDELLHGLIENGILTITAAHCEIHEPGRVSVRPGARELHADRIVALPELVGPSVPGVPGGPEAGFIPIDVRPKVPGIEHVWAAGDATNFAIKHGGIAARQADVAAQAIAALAGLAPEPSPFHPVILGMLLTGGKPCYLSAQVTGGQGSSSQITETPTWSPPTKIAAKYLAPYLEEHDRLARSSA